MAQGRSSWQQLIRLSPARKEEVAKKKAHSTKSNNKVLSEFPKPHLKDQESDDEEFDCEKTPHSDAEYSDDESIISKKNTSILHWYFLLTEQQVD